jgi:hypothetical protein
MELPDSVETFDLDIVCVLLSLVVKPIPLIFNSNVFPVADYQGLIYSISVENGGATLTSGSPISHEHRDFLQHFSTSDEWCPARLVEIADLLKAVTEKVNDISITTFSLQFGIPQGGCPTLLSCEGSHFLPSSHLEPLISSIQNLSLFYAIEVSLVPIPSQCITRSPFCTPGLQNLERSKIVCFHIRTLMEALNFPANSFNYLKRRMLHNAPALMMGFAPVCQACFKYYNGLQSAGDRLHGSAILQSNAGDWGSELLGSARRSLGGRVIRPRLTEYRIGAITQSGLRVTSERSRISLELAKITYKTKPFAHPPPPPPDPRWRYKPRSTEIR